MSRLVLSVKKDVEWVVLNLPDGKKIKVLYKKANNPRQGTLVIECPKDINIKREIDEDFGNK